VPDRTDDVVFRRRLAGVAACLALALAVVALGLVVSAGATAAADEAMAAWLHGLRAPWLDQVMMTASALGDGSQRTAATIVVTAYLLARRRWRWALALVLVMAGASVVTPALKDLFQIARPTALYAGADAFSFPSGHASSATAFYLLLGWMASRPLAPRRRPLVWLVAGAIILLTAVSRIYVGAHWPSDVVGGVALGAALAGLTVAFAAGARQSLPARWPHVDAAAFLLAIGLVAAIKGPAALERARRMYGPYLASASEPAPRPDRP